MVPPRIPARAELYNDPIFEEILDRIASNVRRLREDRRWSQEEAADRCGGMSPPFFRRIELANSNVTSVTLARLARGFGVDPHEFLTPALPAVKRGPGRPRRTPK